MKSHINQESAVRSVSDAMLRAQASRRWMAAVWVVEEGRLYLANKTCFEFPRGDFLAAAKQLLEVLVAENAENAGQFDPLPLATLRDFNDESGVLPLHTEEESNTREEDDQSELAGEKECPRVE